MPDIKERSGAADLRPDYAEIERILDQAQDIIVQSTVRLNKSDETSNTADQDNIRSRMQLDACRRVLEQLRHNRFSEPRCYGSGI